MGKKWNEDVPVEAVLKQVLIENGKLKAEICELKDTLARRDAAIKAFKEWQSNICERSYKYWLKEGLDMVHNHPNAQVVESLRGLLGNNRALDKRIKEIERLYGNLLKCGDRLIKSQETE